MSQLEKFKQAMLDQVSNNIARTKLQRLAIKDMINKGHFDEAISYIETFAGNRKRHLAPKKMQDKSWDALSNKSRNTMLTKFRDMKRTDINHSPLNKQTTWIGVEIECFIPYATLGAESENECSNCEGSGTTNDYVGEDDSGESIYEDNECCDCEGSGTSENDDGDSRSGRNALKKMFDDNNITLSTIKSDGSIETPDNSEFMPIEITILTRLDNPENLKRVCTLLNKLEAKVNKSCGMHVHLDARHLTPDQVTVIGNKFKKALPVMQKLVPKTRRNNSYCQNKVSTIGGDRYSAVNLTAYRRYKTIEIRLHSSTTDFNKIMHWAKLMNAIKDAPKIKAVTELNELTDYITISESTLEYFTQREMLFSVNKAKISLDAQESDNTEAELMIGA